MVFGKLYVVNVVTMLLVLFHVSSFFGIHIICFGVLYFAGYENWSTWAPCSVTCGVGHCQRKRRCFDYEHCRSGNIEITPCKMAPCEDLYW